MSDFDTKRDGVRCEIIETGEVFNSLQACADRLGVSARWLNRVSQGKGLYSVHGYHIKRSDIKPSVNRGGRPGVKVRCVETGEVYNSITLRIEIAHHYSFQAKRKSACKFSALFLE